MKVRLLVKAVLFILEVLAKQTENKVDDLVVVKIKKVLNNLEGVSSEEIIDVEVKKWLLKYSKI